MMMHLADDGGNTERRLRRSAVARIVKQYSKRADNHASSTNKYAILSIGAYLIPYMIISNIPKPRNEASLWEISAVVITYIN